MSEKEYKEHKKALAPIRMRLDLLYDGYFLLPSWGKQINLLKKLKWILRIYTIPI